MIHLYQSGLVAVMLMVDRPYSSFEELRSGAILARISRSLVDVSSPSSLE